MSFRDNHIRVEPRSGRIHVQVQQGDDGPFVTLAVREYQEVAESLAKALRQACSENTDEDFETRRNAARDEEEAAEPTPSTRRSLDTCVSCGQPYFGFGVVCSVCSEPAEVVVTETPQIFDPEGT